MRTKVHRNILAITLALMVVTGCSGKSGNPSKNPDNTALGGTATGTSAAHTEKVPETMSPEKIEEIKSLYIPSAGEAEKLKEEKTQSPIKYSGFKSYYFDTPALRHGLPLVSASPLFSHAGLHNYLKENYESYDFGEGSGSFESFAEGYMESFFDGSGVVVVSFTDDAGGGGYTVTGAWEDVLEIEGTEMKRLVLAVKKTAGNSTAGHFIVEMDTKFISLWDNITISLYE